MTRKSHQVAIVVLCEAEGADALDAASGAQIALARLIDEHAKPDAQEYVKPTRTTCSVCGVLFPEVTEDGVIKRHVSCERWAPEEIDDWDDEAEGPRPEACEGSGKSPRQPVEPVIGFTRRDGVTIYARVHQIMEAGMAAGNGYLWMQATSKGFR